MKCNLCERLLNDRYDVVQAGTKAGFREIGREWSGGETQEEEADPSQADSRVEREGDVDRERQGETTVLGHS